MFITQAQALISLALAGTGLRDISPKVQLGNTTLIGRDVTLLNQDFFGGIPYAEPPIGALRLHRPVLKKSLDTPEFDASNFGVSCLQNSMFSGLKISEDCLTINVLRPSGVTSNASLPVMFWTYGGGFNVGSSSWFNGSWLVAQSVTRGTPIIYVSFNYRLGPLGFPQGQEASDRDTLNLGLSDQIAALTWVQENIGAFGGDKTKVTMFGLSAGAVMTAIQLLNPDISKLARAAILQSGSAPTALTKGPLPRQRDWNNFVSGVLGCENLSSTDNTFECLRSSNTSAIFDGLVSAQSQQTEQFPWSPTIDGSGGFMPELPSLLFAKGTFSKIPFIAGTSLDEGPMFVHPSYNYTTELIEKVIVANYSPPVTQSLSETQVKKAAVDLVALYPDIPALGSPFNTENETFGLSPGFKRAAAVIGDLLFESQRRFLIQTASNAGVKTYGYLFTQPTPGNPAYFGVAHGSETSFVFGTVPNSTASNTELSMMIMDYWVSFTTSLDPNDKKGVSRPTWEQYTPENQAIMMLNGNTTTMIPDDFRKEQIDFINSRAVTFHH